MPAEPWRSVHVGPTQVLLLSKNFEIDEAELRAGCHPSEAEQVATTKSQGRRAEFLRSRWLFHQAHAGQEPLLRGDDGVPVFPNELRGSISHSQGVVALSTAPAGSVAGIGLDIELTRRAHAGIEHRVCNAKERDLLDTMRESHPDLAPSMLAIVFAFKEAIYKAIYPLGRVHFYFEDAELTLVDREEGALEAKLLRRVSPKHEADAIVQGEFKLIEIDEEDYVVAVVRV